MLAAAVLAGFLQTRTEKLPEHLVEFELVRTPLVAPGGRELWAMKTEVPFELFEVWALRLDQTPEQRVTGYDAASRPSKPYGAIFIGHGSHGHPAICVTHLAAKEFASWLAKKTGRPYRLPTLDEWRRLARAGADGLPRPLEDHAWLWENGDDTTHRLASKKPNAWGLHDTIGNVAEWAEGPDGPVVCGGSWRTKSAQASFELAEAQAPQWTESDPQSPKSRWWLSNGQFVGLRLVCDGA
jgi:formylglycine-generating enzyme required for sulfatase activity